MASEYARRAPSNPAGHLLVAIAEEAAGYIKAAIQTITHAVALTPDDPTLRITRARLLVKDRRLREAIADINVVVAVSDARRDAGVLGEAVACRDDLLQRLASSDAPARKSQAPQRSATAASSVVSSRFLISSTVPATT